MAVDLTPNPTGEDRERARALSLQPIQPPTEVPGYDVERFLGRGAFGEVWMALDRNTGCRVAIKFYTHAGGLDWSLLAREVEKLRFLSNDRYVVQLHEIGWEARPPYYVMEYVETSLEDLLRDGPMPLDDAIALFREVAVGLSHAHNKGILHCDLKPGNILLDQDGKPRLADFGQARLAADHSPALGTWFYMAPEQADLTAAPDTRWDVYSLGAVLYRMLTGRPPFHSEESAHKLQGPKLADRLAGYRTLLRESPPPRAHRQVPGIDRGLVEIIDRCLAVQPAKRFANIQAVLDTLDARALRRAQRPLLLLGVFGPALALLVTWLFTWQGIQAHADETHQKTMDKVFANASADAQYMAGIIGQQIKQRWDLLEKEAASSDLGSLVEKADAIADFKDPERQALQAQLETIFARQSSHGSSLFVDGRSGVMLAGCPLERLRDVIGVKFGYRDYFHGLGHDLDKDLPANRLPPPVSRPHISNVFRSRAKLARPWIVVFSVPIWRDPAVRRRSEPPIGILGMSVDVGGFGQFQAGKNKWAVLVDIQTQLQEKPGQRGLILEHPALDTWNQAEGPPNQTLVGPEKPPAVEDLFLNQDLAQKLVRWREGQERDLPKSLKLVDNYHDPFEVKDPKKYGGRWLAAIEPVVVAQPDGSTRRTGWVVIVQESYDDAVGWIETQKEQLLGGLLRRGLLSLLLVIVVVTALSALVMRGLNVFSRSRVSAFFRRRAGLRTADTFVSSFHSDRRSTPAPSAATPQPEGRSLATGSDTKIRILPAESIRRKHHGRADSSGQTPR